MARFLGFASALAAAVLALSACAAMHGDAGWQTLIDGGKGMENWVSEGGANWRVEDGTIMADKRPGTASAFLVSRTPYKNFQIHVEFWVSHDANSGIYMRCADVRPMTDRTCYEANIFDERPDPAYGTGAIVHLAPVHPMPKAGGKWNSFDITVNGPQIVVVLNGVQTASVSTDGKLPSGPVALQYAGGVVKFRKVQIRAI